MSPRAKTKRKAPEAVVEPLFIKVPQWEGLEAGSQFKVVGLEGWFKFLAHVTNPRTNESWIDAAHSGGRHNGMLRAFRPERIQRTGDGVVRQRGMKSGKRKGGGAKANGWHVVTLDAGAGAYVVVFSGPSRKACREHVNELSSPSRLHRTVSNAGVVELTTDDAGPWYIGTVEALVTDSLMAAPPLEDEDDDEEDDDYEEDDESTGAEPTDDDI